MKVHNKLRFFLYTLGCPKNEVDSEIISKKLLRGGFERVVSPQKANIILVNSCGFIKASKEETLDAIFHFHRNRGDKQKIVMIGCLAQRYKGEIEKILPEVDGFIGADAYDNIDKIVRDICFDLTKGRYWGNVKSASMIYSSSERLYGNKLHSHTYVKIADGCSNRCSFCAIPHIKGPYKSRMIDDVLKEIDKLINSGYHEIGLVSQDLTAYGYDIGYKDALFTLLKEIEGIRKRFWVRLYYLYPRRIKKEILELIAESNKIVHYIDIPFQHISDNILLKMKRGHNSSFIKGLIKVIRDVIPDVVIRSAFITGFPGETVKDFNELQRFLLEYRLDNVGFFEYSDEDGTRAYQLNNKLNQRTIRNRYQKLYELQEEISFELNKNRVGKVYDVVIDNEEGRFYVGRYYGQAPDIDGVVYIKKGKKRLSGFVKVKIESADSYDLYGREIC
ncbi:MAG: 30S ribosomal protein S12 methylthiotransferase RimO [Deltaproteobacteria bacterium]|nr:30S ribosomal protein S12 methylthiotransferase RimO [Deltaproteobacteria bacterium]